MMHTKGHSRKNRMIAVLATFVALSGLFSQTTFAASLISSKDTMTRLKETVKADHLIVSTLPDGVDFDLTGGTDTISVDFPADFTVAGTWTTSDFTFNDGTPRTIYAVGNNTAADCTGSTGANDVAVTILPMMQTFTIQPCPSFSPTSAITPVTVTFGILGTDPGGSLTNPTLSVPGVSQSYAVNLSMSDETSITHSASFAIAITEDDQVTATAAVSPSITFDLDSGTTQNSNNDGPHTVGLGTLAVGTLTTSDQSAINSIFIDLSTNASAGATVSVVSGNATGALTSASTGATIDGAGTEQTIAAGTEGFGICLESVTQTAGATLTKGTSYDAAACSAANTGTQTVTSPTTTPSTLLTTSGPIDTGRAEVLFKAAISPSTPAANDYTGILTFIATGTF